MSQEAEALLDRKLRRFLAIAIGLPIAVAAALAIATVFDLGTAALRINLVLIAILGLPAIAAVALRSYVEATHAVAETGELKALLRFSITDLPELVGLLEQAVAEPDRHPALRACMREASTWMATADGSRLICRYLESRLRAGRAVHGLDPEPYEDTACEVLQAMIFWEEVQRRYINEGAAPPVPRKAAIWRERYAPGGVAEMITGISQDELSRRYSEPPSLRQLRSRAPRTSLHRSRSALRHSERMPPRGRRPRR